MLVFEGTYFVTSHILRLDDIIEDAPHGALVAVPSKGGVLVLPIVDLRCVTARSWPA